MADEKASKIEQLVDFLMSKVAEVADDEDWLEADGWIGKWTVYGQNDIIKVYAIQGGKFHPIGEQDTYTGQVEMSEDTFLDLIDGSLKGRGEDVFARKYASRAIRYQGDQWIVDSERFRKILKRIGGIPIRSLR